MGFLFDEECIILRDRRQSNNSFENFMDFGFLKLHTFDLLWGWHTRIKMGLIQLNSDSFFKFSTMMGRSYNQGDVEGG